MNRKKTLVAQAVGGALLGLAAAGAQAEVYGIATDRLAGVTVSTSSGTLGFAATPPASRTSANSATFGGAGPSTSDVSAPPAAADAAPATAGPGPFPADNGGYTQGSALTFTGGFGDSDVSGNPLAGGGTANVTAQARLPGVDAGSASAQGRNAFAGNVLLTLAGTTAGTITLSFTSDLNLVAFSDSPLGATKAQSTARFTLTDIATNAQVLSFEPAALNQEISALGVETNAFNPGPTFYSASTAPLGEGTYRLDLLVQANTSVTQQAVPEPSSALLAALGLGVAGFVTRRRKPRA